MTLLEKNVSIVRGSTVALAVLCATVGLTSAAMAQNYAIQSNTPGFIQKAKDLGAMNPSAVISVTAWLKLHNEDKLDKLVKSQNQKGSANYHKWITQAQFDANFGPSAQEVKALQNFLTAHGLSVIDVAANNAYVKVQGTVGAVEKTFHVQIDNFSFQGQTSLEQNR